jgi:hypothetical protein
VDLDLIDRWRHLVVQHEIEQPVRIEIADADGAYAPGLVQFLHRAPGTVDVAIRLVDQPEIEIVELQLVERALERRLGAFVAGILDPQFRGDEQFPAIDPVVPDGGPHRLLVLVGCRGVEKPVADIDRVAHAALAFGRIRHLKHAEAGKPAS